MINKIISTTIRSHYVFTKLTRNFDKTLDTFLIFFCRWQLFQIIYFLQIKKKKRQARNKARLLLLRFLKRKLFTEYTEHMANFFAKYYQVVRLFCVIHKFNFNSFFSNEILSRDLLFMNFICADNPATR